MVEDIIKKLLGEAIDERISLIADAVAERLTPGEGRNLLQKEACARLGVSQPTLRRLIKDKTIRVATIGGKSLVPESEVEALIEGGRYKYQRVKEV